MHRKFEGKESAAAYSPKPEVTDRQPSDVKFPRMAAAQGDAADDQPADCESGKCQKAAGESTQGDSAESQRPAASVFPLSQS